MPRKIAVIILCCSLLSALSAKSQTGNACNVKAVLGPFGDSVFTAPAAIEFTNASINATDFKLIIGLYEMPLNTIPSGYWGIGPGLTVVKLIAYNGACTDTTVAYYFYAGQFPADTDNVRALYGQPQRDHELTGFAGVTGGGYILSARKLDSWYFSEPQQGILIKTKQAGCVDWARKLGSDERTDIRMVRESADGGFFILADIANSDPVIAKLDATGNTLWAQRLTSSGGTTLAADVIESLPDGGALITGRWQTTSTSIIARLGNNGNIVWQKEYDYNGSYAGQFHNILLKNNYVYIGGNLSYNAYTEYDAFLTKIDFTNGQTIWTKRYKNGGNSMEIRGIVDVDSTLLLNILAPTGLLNTPSIGGYMHLDTSGQILSSVMIGENYTPNTLVGPFMGGGQLIKSGKSFYMLSAGAYTLSLQPGISYGTKIIKFDSAYNVKWVEAAGGAGVPRFFNIAPGTSDGFAVSGVEIGSTVNTTSLATLLSVKQIDSAGGNPNASCYFGRQAFVSASLSILTEPVQWDLDAVPSITTTAVSIPLYPFYPEVRFKCPDYVDSCSYLKVSGPATICNLSQTYTYKTHKNKTCGQPTQWNLPPGIQTVLQTDSSVTVRFPAFGRYVIYVTNPLSCVPVQDSIVVIAASRTPPLELGPDQQICPQNTTILHAGPAFLSYEWQDGSIDSLLTVSQPGIYWVRVTDSCNNILSDTLRVSVSSVIPLSIGPDRIKCNNDTLLFQAEPGFMKYHWAPFYNISDSTSEQVIVNPSVDTVYTLRAEKTPGCFAYDTVKVTVNHSPVIRLGPDGSFCDGDSLVLNAGTGFGHYAWSNGVVSQQLTARTAGIYFVMATDINGCQSRDTIKILSVYKNPAVQLDKNSTLCEGSSRILRAGNYASFLWQDGTSAPSFTVKAPGTYWVTVTDNNHCMGSDTITIDRVVPNPSGFLPPDTTICSYGTVVLQPNRVYNQYLWSDGSSSSSLKTGQPGMYWLQVTDENNCIGIDTTILQPKDCQFGLYVPSAFSPNQDGKNDIFRGLLFGNIKQYRFLIYNRWGQCLFATSDPGKGWDGKYNSIVQDTGVYVWVCTYQLEGENAKSEKGTVTLIK